MKEDLVGGLAFEHQGLLQLVSERCHRVIVILSRYFFDSPVNRFIISFAQALAIGKCKNTLNTQGFTFKNLSVSF